MRLNSKVTLYFGRFEWESGDSQLLVTWMWNRLWSSKLITYNCILPEIRDETIPFGKLERETEHKKWVSSHMLIQSVCDLSGYLHQQAIYVFFSKPRIQPRAKRSWRVRHSKPCIHDQLPTQVRAWVLLKASRNRISYFITAISTFIWKFLPLPNTWLIYCAEKKVNITNLRLLSLKRSVCKVDC